jgi:lipase chaperone LimK
MGLNTSIQQFVKRLNDLNRYLLYFLEENPKQLDQDEIIEILDQSKAPEWNEGMVNANIDIFEMTYEEYVSYFKHLENLEKIRRTNGPNPSSLSVVDNKKYGTSSVGKSSKNHKGSNMWCHYCDKNNHNG